VRGRYVGTGTLALTNVTETVSDLEHGWQDAR